MIVSRRAVQEGYLIEAPLIWVVGNLLMPLMPLLAVWAAVRLVQKHVRVADVLGDGVLFFYSATICAIVMLDLWKFRLSEPALSTLPATCAFVLALILLMVASGAYFLTALARTGVVDARGQPLDLEELSHLSWQVAIGVALFTLIARGVFRVY